MYESRERPFQLLISDFRLHTQISKMSKMGVNPFRVASVVLLMLLSKILVNFETFRLFSTLSLLNKLYFRLPTSDFRLPAPDFQLPTSDFQLRAQASQWKTLVLAFFIYLMYTFLISFLAVVIFFYKSCLS